MERFTSKPPVFIVGCPRSGTTLLHAMLQSSGGFAIFREETKVFGLNASRFRGLGRRQGRQRFLKRWLRSEYFLRSGLDELRFSRAVLRECRTRGDFLRLLMESIAQQQGATRWAEKTPDHVLFMQEIRRHFPDALFVHVIRDGRDAALSLSRASWFRPGCREEHRLTAAALCWKWMVTRGRLTGRTIGPEQYREVRFEDLVIHPREALSSLGLFLDHKLDFDRIQRFAIGAVRVPNTAFKAELRAAAFSPVGRWSRLGPHAIQNLETLIGTQLEELGYSLSRQAGPISLRMRAYGMLLHWRFELGARISSALPGWLSPTFPDPRARIDPTFRPGSHLEYIRSVVGSRQ